jgi:hypothetical protein
VDEPQALDVGRVPEGRDQLGDVVEREPDGEAVVAGGAPVPGFGDRLALDVLHGQVAAAIVDAEIEDVDQVLVRELGHHLGLVQKALGQLLRVATGADFLQNLERAHALHTGLAGERHEDVAHAALAELFEQREARSEPARIAGLGRWGIRVTQARRRGYYIEADFQRKNRRAICR